jgi:hypothetical protein
MPRRERTKEVNIVKYNKYKHYGSGAYCLGFIGAAVYYIQQATGFWAGVLGILKAIVWPAFVVYKLLGM